MITKTQFIKTINALEVQLKKDREFSDRLAVIFDMKDNGMPLYDNSLLLNAILELLNAKYDIEEIARFCFELDFGKANGSDLKSVEDLWNHINLN